MIALAARTGSGVGQDGGGANAAPVDSWTLVHLATGAAAAALGMPFGTFLALSLAYEAAEYAHEWPRGSRVFGTKRPEAAANVAVDAVANVVGYAAAAAALGARR